MTNFVQSKNVSFMTTALDPSQIVQLQSSRSYILLNLVCVNQQ